MARSNKILGWPLPTAALRGALTKDYLSLVGLLAASRPRSGLKRAMDILASCGLLLFLLPVLFAIGAAILCTGREGPVLYGHHRIGRHGRVFRCLKFRTMCVDADRVLASLLDRNPAARAEWAATRKLSNDPRVSRVGRFLRSTSLDELPQLWNVLSGDMSLVGPRPVTHDELEVWYDRFDARHDYTSVRPGITGLWQVSGRSDTSYESRIALDRQYVRTLSLSGDAVILYRTVGAVLRREGAC